MRWRGGLAKIVPDRSKQSFARLPDLRDDRVTPGLVLVLRLRQGHAATVVGGWATSRLAIILSQTYSQ
jgi:hypothetical protein